MRRPSAGRDFRFLWTAGAASSFGDKLSSTSVLLLALLVTRDPTDVGLLAGFSLVAKVLMRLPSGWAADHFPRKRLCFTGEAGSGVLIAGFALLIAMGTARGWMLLVLAVVTEIPYSLTGAVLSGATARLVAPERLVGAMAALQTRESAASTVGPAVGGVLFSVVSWVPLAADAASFFASALLLSRIRGNMDHQGPRDPAYRGVLTGLRYLARDGFARALLAWLIPVTIASSAGYFVVIIALRSHGHSAATVGILTAVGGIGGIIGSLLTPRVLRPGKEYRACLVPTLLMAAVTAGLMLAPSDVISVIVLTAALSLTAPPAQVALTTRLVRAVPGEIRGRLFAGLGLAVELSLAPVFVVVGISINALGDRGTLALVTGVALLAGVVMITSTHLRTWPRSDCTSHETVA